MVDAISYSFGRKNIFNAKVQSINFSAKHPTTFVLFFPTNLVKLLVFMRLMALVFSNGNRTMQYKNLANKIGE